MANKKDSYATEWVEILDKLGLFEFSEHKGYDPIRRTGWSKEDVQNVVDIFESEYGGLEQYIDKWSLWKGIGETAFKIATGQNPDPYAFKFYDTLERGYYNKHPNYRYYGGNKYYQPVPTNEEVLDIFNLYQDKFNVLNQEGVEVLEDIINRGLYKGDYLAAYTDIKRTEKNPELLEETLQGWKWDLDKDREFTVKDLVKGASI